MNIAHTVNILQWNINVYICRRYKVGISRTSASDAVPARDGVSWLTGAVGGPLHYRATWWTNKRPSGGSRQGRSSSGGWGGGSRGVCHGDKDWMWKTGRRKHKLLWSVFFIPCCNIFGVIALYRLSNIHSFWLTGFYQCKALIYWFDGALKLPFFLSFLKIFGYISLSKSI